VVVGWVHSTAESGGGGAGGGAGAGAVALAGQAEGASEEPPGPGAGGVWNGWVEGSVQGLASQSVEDDECMASY
jgi:hypothetical protein